jgi:hypothetical protein
MESSYYNYISAVMSGVVELDEAALADMQATLAKNRQLIMGEAEYAQ